VGEGRLRTIAALEAFIVKGTVAVMGIRDLDRRDYAEVESAVCEELAERPEAMHFLGRHGCGAVAFAAALAALEGVLPPRLVVVVPGRLADTPETAESWARTDETVELRLRHPNIVDAAFLRRATRLLAFWDGHEGRTGLAIARARTMGIPVSVVPVRGVSQVGTAEI
jgi:hypothetical protein